jgi:uncharacterized MAPEG superfamily protein
MTAMQMTTDLWCLLALMVLAASLWIPFIIGVNIHPPIGVEPFRRSYDRTILPDWVQRADRAHLNLLEAAMPFAVIVILAHLIGVNSATTAWLSVLFLCLRLAHAFGMITGLAQFPLRPLIFTAGWACVVAYASLTAWAVA